MKKFLLILLALTFVLFTACSKGGDEKIDVSMSELSKAMVGASEKLEKMSYSSSEDENANRLLGGVCEIDYEKVNSFFISYSKNGSKNADKIAVILLNDAKDADEAKTLLENHLTYQKSLYATYAPEESSKLNAAKVFSFKNAAVLIIADDAEAIETAFYDFVK